MKMIDSIKSNDWLKVILATGIGFIAILSGAIYFNTVTPTKTTTVRIITDNVSGCQYMTGGITGIYPRIGPDGIKIMGCKEQP